MKMRKVAVPLGPDGVETAGPITGHVDGDKMTLAVGCSTSIGLQRTVLSFLGIIFSWNSVLGFNMNKFCGGSMDRLTGFCHYNWSHQHLLAGSHGPHIRISTFQAWYLEGGDNGLYLRLGSVVLRLLGVQRYCRVHIISSRHDT